jgi:hypothetical protein
LGVSAGHFASFRVVKFGISASQVDFNAWFDSPQLHQKGCKSAALFFGSLASMLRYRSEPELRRGGAGFSRLYPGAATLQGFRRYAPNSR